MHTFIFMYIRSIITCRFTCIHLLRNITIIVFIAEHPRALSCYWSVDYSRWCIKRVGGCSAMGTRVFGMLVQGFESGSGAAVSTESKTRTAVPGQMKSIFGHENRIAAECLAEGSHQKVGWRVFSCAVSPSASIRKVVGSSWVDRGQVLSKKRLRTCTERWNSMSGNFLAGCGWNSWWSWGNREPTPCCRAQRLWRSNLAQSQLLL